VSLIRRNLRNEKLTAVFRFLRGAILTEIQQRGIKFILWWSIQALLQGTTVTDAVI